MIGIIKTTGFVSLIFILGCVSSKESSKGERKVKPELSVRVGLNKGGIVENTDFTQLENADVDAYSGATNNGVHSGVHATVPLFSNSIEAGIDYMFNDQRFSYADEINNFQGKRSIGVSQFMMPLTYNFGLLKSKRTNGLLRLKVGFLFQYNVLNVSNSGNLPEYNYNRFSNGLLFGLEAIPFELENGSSLGVYCNLYRGSRIYTDFYNKPDFEVPGSAFFNAGVSYFFNKQ